jgi:cysteine desulfurase
MKDIIYLDYNATVPPIVDALRAMNDVISLPFNASATHALGRKAKLYKDNAKQQILDFLNLSVKNYKIVFTSSGTEANNLVIKNFYQENIIISAIEHLSIFEHAKNHDSIKVAKVLSTGIIDLEDLDFLLASATGKILVSVMIANNETGVIQPIAEIAKLCKKYKAFIHSDCSQLPGKIDIDLSELDLDFITLSGHKLGATVGIGALIMKSDHHLKAQNLGGGQEYGMRSGTENIPAIVAMGVAASLIERHNNKIAIKNLRDKLEYEILKILPPQNIVGYGEQRLINTSMISMPNVQSATQLIHFDMSGVALSRGAACSSGKVKKSHVLHAMHYPSNMAENVIRVSLGAETQEEEIVKFIEVWCKIYRQCGDLALAKH